jgi:endonuclease-3 related protein
MVKQSKLIKIYKKLLSHFGPQAWWPADSPFEVIIGAILTQNTNWKNVEKAIANLKAARVLSPRAILGIRKSRLEKLIRPAGYYRQKTKKLKAFVKYLLREYQGKSGNMKEYQGRNLRKELLEVHGIGPETADSILLYALHKPTFVIDAYTRRIGNRAGLFKFTDYHHIKDYFEQNLPRDLELYKEYHALLVGLGKNFCKTNPVCINCPINRLCEYAAR